jgi:hypothetical protein
MTVFHAPLAMLPNGGAIRRPDLDDPEHQPALAGLAVIEDASARKTSSEAYGTRLHDALNTQLAVTARQLLSTIGIAEDLARTAVGRHRDGLTAEDDVKAVVSADRAVRRDWTAIAMTFLSSVVVVGLYIFTEAKLLGQVVMTSGVLGLLPDQPWHQVFAFAFAGLPVGVAVLKYGWHFFLKTSTEREAHLRRTWWQASHVGFPAWAAAVILLFGPHLISVPEIAEDPFVERPFWAELVSGTILESQKMLQAASGLLALVLIFGMLVSASNLIAAIWISHRETADRARREDVRTSEAHAFRAQAVDGLLADQIQTDASIGRLRGLVDEIAADRAAFADQVVHTVEALRLQGELARRTTILEATTRKAQVIEFPAPRR